MATVQRYANLNGYEYKEVSNDEFFSLVPAYCAQLPLLLQTDLARLYLLRKLLNTYAQALWVDADVYWFNNSLAIPSDPIALTREWWFARNTLKSYAANFVLTATSQAAIDALLKRWETKQHRGQYAFTEHIIRKECDELGTFGSMCNANKYFLERENLKPLPLIDAVNLCTSHNSPAEFGYIIRKIEDHNERSRL